jgi:cupin fold WbuC family metalloprotein
LLELKKISDEVFYSEEIVSSIGEEELHFLKSMADRSTRGRCRICCHSDPKAKLHDMIVVHTEGCYVRPHAHPDKHESLMVIEGSADFIIFDGAGNLDQVIKIGDKRFEKCFVRTPPMTFHSLVIKSRFLVFHEATTGPFQKNASIFPHWSPEDGVSFCLDDGKIKQLQD